MFVLGLSRRIPVQQLVPRYALQVASGVAQMEFAARKHIIKDNLTLQLAQYA